MGDSETKTYNQVNMPKQAQPISDIRPHQANSITPKNLHRSNTLMRKVVQKPIITVKAPVKISTNQQLNHQPGISYNPKRYVTQIDPKRQQRAKVNSKSEFVGRFKAASTVATVSETTAPTSFEAVESLKIPVLDEIPAATTTQAIYNPPEQPPQLYNPDDIPAQPIVDQPSMEVFKRNFELPDNQSYNNFETKEKKGWLKKSLAIAGVLSLFILLVGGFLVYQNFNKIGVALASSKAGFHVVLPKYNPGGYGLASISSASGEVQTSYHSNSDSRNYTLSEKTTNWDSTDLLNDYVDNVAGLNYQIVNNGGKVIYIYGNKNATWINNGIWYIVTSNNSLSNQQLIELATTS